MQGCLVLCVECLQECHGSEHVSDQGLTCAASGWQALAVVVRPMTAAAAMLTVEALLTMQKQRLWEVRMSLCVPS